MNPENYCTLEAAKRLIEAGIVVETERAWSPSVLGGYNLIFSEEADFDVAIPALSMAEAWRLLPDCYKNDEGYMWLKSIEYENREGNIASYVDPWGYRGRKGFQRNTNPIDALIDLYIWCVKEGKVKP